MAQKLIKIKMSDIAFAYRSAFQPEHTVFSNLNAVFETGALNIIVGKSGSGKTTLLRLLAGREKAQSGSITYSPSSLKETTYFLSNLDESYFFSQTLREEQQLCFEQGADTDFFQIPGITDKILDTPLQHLSDGYRRLARIAIALWSGASTLLLDEPLNTLDFFFRNKLRFILEKLAMRGKLIIIATHDYDIYTKNRANFVELTNGKITGFSPKKKYYHYIKELANAQ